MRGRRAPGGGTLRHPAVVILEGAVQALGLSLQLPHPHLGAGDELQVGVGGAAVRAGVRVPRGPRRGRARHQRFLSERLQGVPAPVRVARRAESGDGKPEQRPLRVAVHFVLQGCASRTQHGPCGEGRAR